MPVIMPSFDLDVVEWRRITDATCTKYIIDFEYSLLGYDLPSGRLDMLLRYGKNGHCRSHRHIASTTTLVLEGEQFLLEQSADGTTRTVHRTKGDYALSPADALPHDEHGGPDGGTVMLSMTALDGVLFEYFDATNETSWTLSIEQYVESWNQRAAYGAVPTTLSA